MIEASAYLTGDVLHLDYVTYDPGIYACITVIAYAEFDLEHPALSPGTYRVEVYERQYVGSWLVNEFLLVDELTVTGALGDEAAAWGRVKAIYR